MPTKNFKYGVVWDRDQHIDEIEDMFAPFVLYEKYKSSGCTLSGSTLIEWISVEEKLPECNGRYLTHCNLEGQSLVCILHYCKVGGFNEDTVTHWMPLPEPPIFSKGG
jgi:hypothetical protein